MDAAQDGVVVPTTLEDYCISGRAGYKNSQTHSRDSELLYDDDDEDDNYDDEFYGFDADDDEDIELDRGDSSDLLDSMDSVLEKPHSKSTPVAQGDSNLHSEASGTNPKCTNPSLTVNPESSSTSQSINQTNFTTR